MGIDVWFALLIVPLAIAAFVVASLRRRRHRDEEVSSHVAPRATPERDPDVGLTTHGGLSSARPAGDVTPLEDERTHGRTFVDDWLGDDEDDAR